MSKEMKRTALHKTRKTILPGPTEHQIQSDIIGFLKYKGYYVQRMNSGKYSVGEGVSKRFIQGAQRGTPDIMAFKKADCDPAEWGRGDEEHVTIFLIEVKLPGNKPTIHQAMKMKELESYGAKCFVAYSVADVEKMI